MWVIFALVLVGVIPFLVFLHVFPLGDLPSYWLSSTAVLGGAVTCLFLSRGRIGWSRFHVGFGVGLVGLLLIAALGGAPSEDFRGLLIYVLVVFVAALLAAGMAESSSGGYYVKLAWVMVIGGGIQAISALALHYGVLSMLGRWMIPPGTRMTGLLAQSNLLALYVFLSFLSLCYLYVTGRVSLLFCIFVGLLFGVVIAGTGSRAALVYSVAACSMLLVPRTGMLGQRKIKLFLMFALLWACIPLYFMLDARLQPVLESMGYIDRPTTSDAYRDYATVGFRPSEWRKAAIMLWQHPFLGVGIGNYGVNSFWMGVEYPWAVTESSFPIHSHNIFAQVAAEFGVGGLAVVVAGIVFWVRRILRVDRNAEWWLTSSVFIVFLVNAMIEYALWELHFAVVFLLFVVPFFGEGHAFRISKYVATAVFLGIGVTWGSLSLGMFDIYGKAIRYSNGVGDDLESYELKVAGDDFLLGRDMELLYALNVLPETRDLDYYDGLTKRLMAWRPVNIVLVRRMQVAALKEDEAEVLRMAHAMARFYPKDVPKLRRFLSEGEGGANVSIRKALDAQNVPSD